MKYLPAAAFGCLMLAAAPAWAAEGYTLSGVNLRAGPGTGYPVLAQMPPGIPLAIQGCLAGGSWCDVASGPLRGWVSGRYIGGALGGPPVVSVQIGAPFLVFDLASYWDNHYRDRRFYHQRDSYRHAPQPYYVKKPQMQHHQPQPPRQPQVQHRQPQQQKPQMQHRQPQQPDCRAPGGRCR
ncbi:SH3 domain-containing protein [Oleispirillum naphthae]|uniref:SH3 domain-containing protein n=1 Tax=Oleispirillum naphthae TaxID=2838853 RepID=UPI0030825FEF